MSSKQCRPRSDATFCGLIWVYTVYSGLSFQYGSRIASQLVSVMSYNLIFTHTSCVLTYILPFNKQSGYPAWLLQLSYLTPLTQSQLAAWGSTDRWVDQIQRVLWHRWLMSSAPISKVSKTKPVSINAFPISSQLAFEVNSSISTFLGFPLQSKYCPFGDRCEFSNNIF